MTGETSGRTSVRTRVGTWTAKGSLGRASALTAVGSGAGRAVGLVSALGGAAVLGSAQYGAFTFLATTATLVSSLGVLGFGPLVTRAVASRSPTPRVDQLAAAVLCIVTALLLVVGLCLAAVVNIADLDTSWPGYRLLHGTGVGTVVVWATGAGLSAIVTAVITGHRRFVPATMLTLARSVAVGGSAFVTSVTTGRATDAATAAGVAELLVAAAGVALLRRERYLQPFQWRSLVAPVASLTRGAVPAGAASLSIQAAIWFTESLLLLRPDGLSENGAFGLASRLSLLVSFLPVALATASVSFVSRQPDAAQARALAKRIIMVGFGASLVAMVMLVGTAAHLNGLFGTGYSEHASTTALMGVAGLAVSANALLGNTAVGLGRVRDWVASDIVLAASMTIAAYVLIPPTGPDGAAITHLLSYGISAGYLTLRLWTAARAST